MPYTELYSHLVWRTKNSEPLIVRRIESRVYGFLWKKAMGMGLESTTTTSRSDALGVAIPYGIYDVQANCGCIFVGTSYDTSEFAVESIEAWWREEGSRRYSQAKQILILADTGGSNSARVRAWKYMLQTQLCDPHGLSVTVSHYPTGASKYNPIEHRLFSEISKNWAGHPLTSYETILNHIRTTRTTTGLKVKAHLVTKQYTKGIKISDKQMDQLALDKHSTLPKWNYTLKPRENGN